MSDAFSGKQGAGIEKSCHVVSLGTGKMTTSWIKTSHSNDFLQNTVGSFPGRVTLVQVKSNDVHFQCNWNAAQEWKVHTEMVQLLTLCRLKDKIKGINRTWTASILSQRRIIYRTPPPPHPYVLKLQSYLLCPAYNQRSPVFHTTWVTPLSSLY